MPRYGLWTGDIGIRNGIRVAAGNAVWIGIGTGEGGGAGLFGPVWTGD